MISQWVVSERHSGQRSAVSGQPKALPCLGVPRLGAGSGGDTTALPPATYDNIYLTAMSLCLNKLNKPKLDNLGGDIWKFPS
jgi:hypothetical protein